MKIRFGYDITYTAPQPTPMILMLHLHYTRVSKLLVADHLRTTPAVPISSYRDSYGNWCSRVLAPAGDFRITADGLLSDSGLPEEQFPQAQQVPVQDLPEDCLVFLLGSRYCDIDRLFEIAWQLFGQTPPGWARVQAICSFVHQHIQFGYEHARPTRTAFESYQERRGVCRDFAHLAVALCRCMNIPARYCTGYLSDIGVPVTGPMDFAAWFEAFLGGEWHTFDPRNNAARAGRLLIARGRDAADVAISTSFGPNVLKEFKVWTDEVIET